MSGARRRIFELCNDLGGYAGRLEELRADHPVSRVTDHDAGGDAPLWGGTVGAGASRVNGTPYWFADIEPRYAELDELIRYASRDLCDEVYSDERVRTLAPHIHRLRAAYERDKELIQARALANASDARERLAGIIEQESYWAFGDELRRALAGARHILVAGSGPLPLTAMCIGAALDVRLTCVERDPECHLLGRQLIAIGGLDDRSRAINADILDLTDFEDYDAIVGVVLLGVGTEGNQTSAKAVIARHVIDHMPPGTRMVLRDPHGLGRLLYPSVELDDSAGIRVTRRVPRVGPDHPYRSGLVVAERRASSTGHAH